MTREVEAVLGGRTCTHVNNVQWLVLVDDDRYTVAKYIETVPHRSSPPAILLRESTRVGKQVRK